MTPTAVMIFAAGLGTRMGALTRDLPKPLIKVGGKALIDHALDLVPAIAPERVVVNLHYRAEQLRHHLAERPVLFSDESERLLETGGGLRQALALLQADPVYTMNSDAVWTGQNPLARLRDAWNPTGMEALVHLVPHEDAMGHTGPGDFDLDETGRIRRGKTYIYTGAQIIRTNGLAGIDQEVFSLNLLWNQMIGRGTAYGTVHQGKWCDVGRPESLALAETLLADRHV